MRTKVNKIEHYVNKAIKSSLETALSKSYSIDNPGLRKVVERPVSSINALHRLIAERRENRLYLASGKAKGSGLPMRVGFVGLWEYGQTNILPFFQHLFFEEDGIEMQDLGTCSDVNPRRQAELFAGQADLVAVLTHQQRTWMPLSGDWVQFPSVVRMAFHYHPGEDWDAIEHRIKKHQRRNLTIFHREKFTGHFSDRDEDFHYFYDRLYQPMVRSRYKDYGALVHKTGLHKLFKNRGLLLLVKDASGEIVSGALSYIRHRVLYALVNGVRDGDYNLIRRGALTAVHYFALQKGLELGVRCFDVGVGVPLLNDGVYQHKRQWCYEPDWNHWDTDAVLLWAPHSAPAAIEWLRANPALSKFARWGGPAMNEIYAAESAVPA